MIQKNFIPEQWWKGMTSGQMCVKCESFGAQLVESLPCLVLLPTDSSAERPDKMALLRGR